MQPLTHCPGCGALLIRKIIPDELNSSKYEHCSKRCVVDYFQYYNISYEETQLSYIVYNTPDEKFHICSYFNFWGYKNVSHIYANATLKKYGTSMPLLKLPMDRYPLDVINIEKVQERIATLATFV
jgi:hypothetical protein